MKDKIGRLLESKKINVNKIKKLPGDASDRKFYRVYANGESLIILIYPEPIDKNLNLIKAYKLYTSSNLPISEIIDIIYDEGIIILKDLGNESLQKYVKKNKSQNVWEIYCQAIDLIQKIQKRIKELDPSYLSSHYKLNEEKLLWELNFFLQNYIQKHLKIKINNYKYEKYNSLFKTLINLIDFKNMVLCHRDFHSRNLFIIKNKIYIVDYQDTTLGPPLYDLASLLFDSYLLLSKKLREKLIEYAYNLNNYNWNQEKFYNQLILTSLQRNIKALGTFGFQIAVKKRKRYLAYIPRTLSYINENILNFPEIAEFKDLIKSWKK